MPGVLGGGVPNDDGDPPDPRPDGRPSFADPVAWLPRLDRPGCPGVVAFPYGLPPTGLYGRGAELNMFGEGSPVPEYFGPGGTSFRMLLQPEATTTVPNITASVPPATARLSRSIDLISSFPEARRPAASRR